jgi:hypothetical protein
MEQDVKIIVVSFGLKGCKPATLNQMDRMSYGKVYGED